MDPRSRLRSTSAFTLLTQDFFSFGIVGRFQVGHCWKARAGNVDFVASVANELGCDAVLGLHIAHADCSAERMAVRTRSRIAHRFAIAVKGFAAPEHGAG